MTNRPSRLRAVRLRTSQVILRAFVTILLTLLSTPFGLSGRLLATPLPGEFDLSFRFEEGVLSAAIRRDGRMVTATRRGTFVLEPDGSVHQGPFPPPSTSPLSALTSFSVSLLPDDSVFISGAWLQRLSPDGTLETLEIQKGGYDVQAPVLIQLAGGGYVVRGAFRTNAASPYGYIAQLNQDLSFKKDSIVYSSGGRPGRVGTVSQVIVQPDGRYLACGYFEMINGVRRMAVARFFASGALDPGFHPGLLTNSAIWAMGIQKDGRIIVGGWAAVAHRDEPLAVARLMPDGAVDRTFAPVPYARGSEDVTVRSLALDSQDRIYVTGTFDRLGGGPPSPVARLQPDGRIDYSYQTPTFEYVDPSVRSGRLLVDAVDRVFVVNARPGLAGFERWGILKLHGDSPSGLRPGLIAETQRLTLPEGNPAELYAPIQGVPYPTLQWFLNGSAISGATNAHYSLHNVRTENAGAYRLVASNGLGVVRRQVAVLNVVPATRPGPGDVDVSFRAPSGPRTFSAAAVLPDGGWVHAETYFSPSALSRGGERISAIRKSWHDGEVDPAFWIPLRLPEPDTTLRSVLLPLPDEQIAVAGNFEGIGDSPRRSIARITRSGDLDESFRDLGGADGPILALAAGPAGALLVGGAFTNLQGAHVGPLARLWPDGSIDPSFVPPSFGPGARVSAIWPRPDGPIIVQVANPGQVPEQAERLFSLDAAGVNAKLLFEAPRGTSNLLAHVASDGRVYVIAAQLDDAERHQLIRLKADGTLDPTLPNPVTVVGLPSILLADRSGRMLVGGAAGLRIGEEPLRQLVRLNADGSIDASVTFDDVVLSPAQSSPLVLPMDDKRLLVFAPDAVRVHISDVERNLAPSLVGTLGDQDLEAQDQVISAASLELTAPIRGESLSHQWFLNGHLLQNQTEALLHLDLPSTSDLGLYQVVGSNAFGSVTSRVASVRLTQGPARIVPERSNLQLNAGQSTVLRTQIRAGWPYELRWLHNGVSMEGENQNSLVLAGTSPRDSGAYQAVVQNALGETHGPPTSLVVKAGEFQIGEALDSPELDWRVTGYVRSRYFSTADGGDALQLGPVLAPVETIAKVSVALVGPGQLRFSWKLDPTQSLHSLGFSLNGRPVAPIPGVDSLTNPTSDWTEQRVTVPAGVQTAAWTYSSPATLANAFGYLDRVQFQPGSPPPPILSGQPIDITLLEGATAKLGVGATSSIPLRYQWRKNANDLLGETRATWNKALCTEEDAGGYDVVVSNDSGSVTSRVAIVTIQAVEMQVSSIELDPEARAIIKVPSQLAQTHQLEISEDLEHWEILEPLFSLLPEGGIRLSDPVASDRDQRFYRFTPYDASRIPPR